MNNTIKIAAILGALGVAIGAFGAHAIKDYLLETNRLSTFETSTKYHFYHALALLLVGILQLKTKSKWLNWSANLLCAGVIVFSGSLYLLCLTQCTWFGMITPIGGVLLILGWLFLLKVSIKTQI